MKAAVLVLVMALVTILLRFLPFMIFRKRTPAYIAYLGKVLPPAIIGMLVIYCLRDVRFTIIPTLLDMGTSRTPRVIEYDRETLGIQRTSA